MQQRTLRHAKIPQDDTLIQTHHAREHGRENDRLHGIGRFDTKGYFVPESVVFFGESGTVQDLTDGVNGGEVLCYEAVGGEAGWEVVDQ